MQTFSGQKDCAQKQENDEELSAWALAAWGFLASYDVVDEEGGKGHPVEKL